MNGKTFKPDNRNQRKLKIGSAVTNLFIAVVIALSFLQLANNVRISNNAQEDRAAATFFAESVEQICTTTTNVSDAYRGLCAEANEYSQNIGKTYDLMIDMREVDSIECKDDGSIIHFENGETFNSDRLCGQGPMFLDQGK